MNLNTALSGATSAGSGAMGGIGGAALPMPSGQSLYDSLGGGAMELSARSATPGLTDLFKSTAEKYGLPQGYLDRTAQLESSLNPHAAAKTSSAKGLFQFVDGTAKQYGLTNPFDAAASTNAAAQLAADNAKMFRSSLGREPTPGELYLAHQQGAGGAVKLLSNPSARAVDAVGRQAVLNNGGDPNMTAGEFANKWISKFDKGGGAPQSATFATASTDLGGFAGAKTGKTDDSNPLLALLGGAKDGAGDLMSALGGGSQKASAPQWQSQNNPNKAPTLAEYVAAYLKSRRV
jgi:hypothetical protein